MENKDRKRVLERDGMISSFKLSKGRQRDAQLVVMFASDHMSEKGRS